VSLDKAQKLRSSLHQKLDSTEPQYTATAISDAIEFHDGRKALIMNFVGNVGINANITVRTISRSLFDSEVNDRILVLEDQPELMLKSQIFRQLKQWPLSIIVMNYHKMVPQSYDFLTSIFDTNFPQLELNNNIIKTNQAIFIIVSNILQGEISKLYQDQSLHLLDKLVKDYMKENDWPARICQRMDYVIPFF